MAEGKWTTPGRGGGGGARARRSKPGAPPAPAVPGEAQATPPRVRAASADTPAIVTEWPRPAKGLGGDRRASDGRSRARSQEVRGAILSLCSRGPGRPPNATLELAKIGRAACRERVCP